MHNGFEAALSRPTKEIPRKMGIAAIDYVCCVEGCAKHIKKGQFHYHPIMRKRRKVRLC